MSAIQFLGSKFKSLKSDGSINATGTVEFFTTGGTFSTYLTSYSDSALSVANSNIITLDSAGEADIWLGVTADVRIKDSAGTTLDTFLNWNPGSEVAVDTVYNSALNGSFENGTNAINDPVNWVISLYSTGAFSLDSTSQSHGQKSLKFTSVGAGGGTATSEDFFAVSKGEVYELSWQMISSTAGVRNMVQIFWYKADQTASSTPSVDAYDDSTTNPTSWTTKTYNATAPSDAYYAKIRLIGCHSSDSTSGNTRFDEIRFLQASVYGTRVFQLIRADAGIKFPAVQNAISDVNTLDDYEEGTWTPVLTFETPGNLSVAYDNTTSGRYVKIGKQVTVWGSVTTTTFTHTTASGTLLITGLPFAFESSNDNYFVSVTFQGITKTNYTQVTCCAASTTVRFRASGSGQSVSDVVPADMPTGGTVKLNFVLPYTT